MRAEYVVPEHDREVGMWPPLAEWPAVLKRNRAATSEWSFDVAGVDFRSVRRTAREELLVGGAAFCERLGIPARHADATAPIVLTGHQPELFHPGVWIKHIALQRVVDLVGGSGIDVVVDSDAFKAVVASAPVPGPQATRSDRVLVTGGPDVCFACTAGPTPAEVSAFCEGVSADLSGHEDDTRANAGRYCEGLRHAATVAGNLAETITVARRTYEAALGTTYLEYPVSMLSRSRAFARFVIDIVLNAERFAGVVNTALAEHRAEHGIRSNAQPFADMVVGPEAVEVPLWALTGGRRETVHVHRDPNGYRLCTVESDMVSLPADPDSAVDALLESGLTIAPKAVALTLFTRLFVSDLFIHGIGGARYDEVTDAVCSGYYGVEPPPYVVATLTMHLPIAKGISSVDGDISTVKEKLNRLSHNPDEVISAANLSPAEQDRAHALSAEKDRLVAAISQPGADKKSLGKSIREINAELAAVLDPLRAEWARDLDELESRRYAALVLAARDYPFFYWSPEELDATLTR